jgi:hypothetical protein
MGKRTEGPASDPLDQVTAGLGLTGSMRTTYSIAVVGDYFWITEELRKDCRTLFARAMEALARVDSWKDPATVLGADTVPLHLCVKVHELFQWAHRAALQNWVTYLFAIDCRIGSRAELLAWCRLQDTVLDRHAEAFRYGPLAPPYRAGEDQPGRDWIGDAIKVIEGMLSGEPERRRRSVALLEAMPQMPRFETTPQAEAVLPQAACKALIHSAWGFMRRLGDRWPVEPHDVADTGAARRFLDQVVDWCIEKKGARGGTPAVDEWVHAIGEDPPTEFRHVDSPSDSVFATKTELGWALRSDKHRDVSEQALRDHLERIATGARPKVWLRETGTRELEAFFRSFAELQKVAELIKQYHERKATQVRESSRKQNSKKRRRRR